MLIITNFKIKDNNYISRLARKGDVVVFNFLKAIRTDSGFVTELGYTLDKIYSPIRAVIKREEGDYLEDLLIEGEKICYKHFMA